MNPNTMSAAQSRAARALLDWSRGDLAGKVGFGEETIESFESGGSDLASGQIEALRSALMAAGVVFTEDGSAGVRLSDRGGDEGTRLGALTTENDR
nr:XRE family transcriptional regulator [Methylobacterium sp. Leaf112]USU33621.1 XRE family transcriptional regulator [Methylobacterium sp. OTU13CASTA1]